MEVVNIINPSLANQRATGEWIEAGFKALGYRVITTSVPGAQGDVTVVHGPNYAKRGKQGRVIWLDRCWYGDTRDWVSLGWKVDEHSRAYVTGYGSRFDDHVRAGIVAIEPMRSGNRVIALDDYDQTLQDLPLPWDGYRAHPARQQHTTTLLEAIEGYSKALCGAGTCAAQAWLAGLEIACFDKHNVVKTAFTREQWADQLAWKQWHRDEIRSGAAIEWLMKMTLTTVKD